MFSSNDTSRNANNQDIDAQLKQLREDLSNLAKSVTDAGNDKAYELPGKARRAANHAADASRGLVDAARGQAENLERDFQRQIRSNPIQAVAVAAGVGFLFALLTRR